MKLPLEKRLRKHAHVLLGQMQDELMEILYSISNRFILHGGTSIWRCYAGLRFSEDLDLYLDLLPENFRELIEEKLHSRQLQLKKYKQTDNLIFIKATDGNIEARVEINLRGRANPIPVPYEKINGTSMIVNSLSLDDLIIEKANAFASRRLIRDVYDVYFLSANAGKSAMSNVRRLLEKSQKPLDERNLESLVYSGTVPAFDKMMHALIGR
ncbi:MAG: nucleotidyl transferase AbiEii/AbiGii toxin family protein [Candidatus Micrarchaeota archaeon]